MIWVPAQLVGAYHGDTVSLTCFVEAHPASLNYWEKDGVMIHANNHYQYTQERGSPAYKVHCHLLSCVYEISDLEINFYASLRATFGKKFSTNDPGH